MNRSAPVPEAAPAPPALPELLAPAGNAESLRAALAAGADAVYLGLHEFNARLRAENFTRSGLAEAVDLAHRAGRRVYLTLNTLLEDAELPRAVELLRFARAVGVDAAIVQDLGLLRAARAALPDCPIHASTQMTVHNAPQLERLLALGVRRVILARELDLAEVARLAELARARGGGEVEVFAHGALCVSYSGQCLAGHLLAGRSGNRGVCAQPCRDFFRLLGPAGEIEAEHLLSLRDLWTLPRLDELVAAGVAGLKIEGRMKRPEYVAGVVAVYREALDRLATGERGPWPRLESRLASLFNRGFTGGGLAGELSVESRTRGVPGPRVHQIGPIVAIDVRRARLTVRGERELAPGDGVFAAPRETGGAGPGKSGRVDGRSREAARADARARGEPEAPVAFYVTKLFPPRADGTRQLAVRVLDRLDESLVGRQLYLSGPIEALRRSRRLYERWTPPAVSLSLELAGRPGEPLAARARTAEGTAAEAASAAPLAEPRRQPLTVESARTAFGRLGGTRYRLKELALAPGTSGFLPLSQLNELRRRLVEELDRRRAERLSALSGAPWTESPEKPAARRTRSSVLLDRPELVPAAVAAGAARIYLARRWEARPAAGAAELWLATGPITPRAELARLAAWLAAHRGELAGVLAGNLGAAEIARAAGLAVWADVSLNLANREAARELRGLGLAGGTLGWEVEPVAALALAAALDWPLELIVAGRPPAFVIALRGLDRREAGTTDAAEPRWLVDGRGHRLPVTTDPGAGLTLVWGPERCERPASAAALDWLRLELRGPDADEAEGAAAVLAARVRAPGST